MEIMEWTRSFFVGVFFWGTVCSARSSHLVLFSVGEGAIIETNGKQVPLPVASFLPFETEIYVRQDSGVETLLAGYNFRFGHNTRFLLAEKGIQLKSGMIMIQSRKIDNACKMVVGNSVISFAGAGTWILEHDGEKLTWITGILGRIRMTYGGQNDSAELMPGDLFSFDANGEMGTSRADLMEVISSSFLIFGFKNNISFQKSLEKVAAQQKLDLNSQTDDVITALRAQTKFTNEISEAMISEVNATAIKEYSIPEADPLRELLGREPRRFGENVVFPILEESSFEMDEGVSPVEESVETIATENEVESKPRPFPSRLLRKNSLDK